MCWLSVSWWRFRWKRAQKRIWWLTGEWVRIVNEERYNPAQTEMNRSAGPQTGSYQAAYPIILPFIQQGYINRLKPNDPYRGHTAPLTSKCCILYIYSTNIGTEYFKHGIYSPSFFNAVCFIILIYLVPVLFTFYIQDVLKFKKIIPAPKGQVLPF